MKKILLTTLLIIGALSFGVWIHGSQVLGMSQTGYRSQTSTATTTNNFMTPGTGTTTLSVDTLQGNQGVADSMNMYVHLTASTTATELNWVYEYSMDNIDWYREDLQPTAITFQDAVVYHSSTTATHVWTPGDANASTTRKIFDLPVKAARYMRVVFSLPAGSTNGTIWAETVPVKEIK